MLHCLNPTSISPPFARYSHGVQIPGNTRLIMTSGQLAMSPEGTIPATARDQADLCFHNIGQILAEANASAADVVKINAFVTERSYMRDYMDARDAWLSHVTTPPASTLMIVSGFTREEFLVEVEVIAALTIEEQ